MRKPRPYSPAVTRRFLALYYRANAREICEGRAWYDNAHRIAREIAEAHGVSVEQAAGVIAVLSPGCAWERNVEQAEDFISAWQAGARGKWLPRVGVYGRGNRKKAERILRGKPVEECLGTERAVKVRAFYANIAHPETSKAVTVDRHIRCAAHGITEDRDSGAHFSLWESGWIAKHLLAGARQTGERPHAFQAIVWLVWKRLVGADVQED